MPRKPVIATEAQPPQQIGPIECWTDYPIVELGDEPGKIAPIRQCTALSWDGDKYADVLVEGIKTNFKVGYLYPKAQRCGDGPPINRDLLPEGNE